MLDEMTGARITVMGLGRFGGGAGAARWLAERGARVRVTDLASREILAGPLGELADLIDCGSITLRLGGHEEADFAGCDLVVANPAVPRPWENAYLRTAREAGAPITTEIRLLLERLDRRRVIGITGTAGKSTTAAMIHHVLTRAGHRSHLGGNIGGSLLNRLDEIHGNDRVVLELSSAMLYWLGAGVGYEDAAGISPHVAVLTNLAPNHLDWHGSFEHYAQSKRNIFAFQTEGDHAVVGDEVPDPAAPIDLKVPGPHNQRNAAIAIAAVERAIGMTAEEAAPLLADFAGLPHRLRLVAEHDGLRFYDDSKATTPEATVLAVRSFPQPQRVHLIAGGYDKQIDLTPIADLADRLAGLYTIGATGRSLAAAAGRADKAIWCETLDRAVAAAVDRMQPGHILLLSPGCASWDQFENYEQRGAAFAAAVPRRLGSRYARQLGKRHHR
ncbi:MAG: UDP-N-acetylmuramoyl-L-alanine--D-glutamate ligase [Planctomycetota bacterium]|nr:UDP-N-acetylmuramoyl-L-alanine--D-glutamate ligase [Planctomycetota bacterium]